MDMKKKKSQILREWLVETQESAVNNHDYTRYITLREVIRKLDSIQ